jgi:hypothetical protein
MGIPGRIFSGLLAILIFVAFPMFAYEVALKDGRIMKFGKYRVTERTLLYTDENGKEIAISLTEVDLDRTRQLNEQEAVPLNLPGLVLPSRTASQNAERSLAEIALQLRLQRDLRDFCNKKHGSELCKEMTPEEMAKRVVKESAPAQIDKLLSDLESFTGDDHSWAGRAGGVTTGSGAANVLNQNGSPGMPTDPSQLEILNLSCEALAKAMLQAVAPELDVPFPERGEWERDLCRVRNEWHDQYLRYEAHKGTSTEIDERKKAADWWNLLEGTAWVGPAKARLYVDKQNSHR